MGTSSRDKRLDVDSMKMSCTSDIYRNGRILGHMIDSGLIMRTVSLTLRMGSTARLCGARLISHCFEKSALSSTQALHPYPSNPYICGQELYSLLRTVILRQSMRWIRAYRTFYVE